MNKWALILLVALVFPAVTSAQTEGALSVTVTPPLVQLTIGRGESWASSLKVVNTNPYDVTYYAQVMDFSADGEGGAAALTPIVGGASIGLASWVSVPVEPVTVPSGSSAEVPFTVSIPTGASPGGHYAAILIGTQPPQTGVSGASVAVSSFVSSLLFVRIEGEVIERGRIREFRTEREWYQTNEASFLLRFENTGNTHLLPRGLITIYNMWGKERGVLSINESSSFGNVLPQSVRKFEFSWKGDAELFDIGRYSAITTLSFGDGGKQSVSGTTYFWVVPVVPVASVLGSVLLFVLALVWFIRRYIRRALMIERERRGIASEVEQFAPPAPLLSTLAEPLREGVVDLRRAVRPNTPQVAESPAVHQATLTEFVSKYKLFFLFILLVLVAVLSGFSYLRKALDPEHTFEVREIGSEQEGVIQ